MTDHDPSSRSASERGHPSQQAERDELLAALLDSSDPPADELALAAALESRGIDDDIARDRFGAEDVFALAALLNDRWPDHGTARRPTRPAAVRGPDVVRGATYLIPAMFILLADASELVGGPLVALAVVTCLGWGATQALARVAYASIGRGGSGAARRYLSWVLVIGAALAVVVGWSVGANAESTQLGVIVGAQMGYLTLAVVVLPQRRDAVLVIAMVPAIAATGGALVLGVDAAVAVALALGGEVAVGLVMAASLWRTDPEQYGSPGRNDVADTLPFMGTGLSAAAFVLGSTAIGVAVLGDAGTVVALAVAVTLCMGVAEIQIADVRRRIDLALDTSSTIADFAERARRALGAHALLFVVVAATALGALFLAIDGLRSSDGVVVGLIMLLVGVSLFLNLCLMIVEGVGPALVTFSAAALALGLATSLATGGASGAGGVVLVVAASVCIALWVAVRASVTHPARHTFH